MRHIILISGKDSLATAIVQLRNEPDLEYELVHNEVGWDLPETLEWIDRVELSLGRKITRCGDDLTEICYEQNCLPLAGLRRFCTKYAKIKPLNDYLGKLPATIYFGLRSDEPDRVGYDPPKHQTAKYPLREHGIDLAGVWKICEQVDLLPPAFYWGWVESRVRELNPSLSVQVDLLPPWERRALFAWRSRSNCDRCPYQRQYEWIGLLEHHPDLFEDACVLEEKLCHRDEFTWVQGYRLRQLALRHGEIRERRARRVAAYLNARQQMKLFAGDEINDELQVTSCGLLCGK